MIASSGTRFRHAFHAWALYDKDHGDGAKTRGGYSELHRVGRLFLVSYSGCEMLGRFVFLGQKAKKLSSDWNSWMAALSPVPSSATAITSQNSAIISSKLGSRVSRNLAWN